MVAAKNGSDAFPSPLSEPDLKTKIILNPYQVACDAIDVIGPKLVLWMGGCPICGKLKNEDIDEFAFDADDDEGDDEPAETKGVMTIPLTTRRQLRMTTRKTPLRSRCLDDGRWKCSTPA